MCKKTTAGMIGGGVLFVIGITLLTVGAIIKDSVNDQINTRVANGLPVNEAEYGEEDWQEYLNPESSTWKVNVFHITNALDIQLNGAKPVLEEKTYTVEVGTQKINPKVVNDVISFQERVWYNCPNNDCYEEVVTVNPVYIGAADGAAPSEAILFASTANGVVNQLGPQFTDPDGDLLTAYKTLAVGSYMGGVAAAVAAHIPPSGPASGSNPFLGNVNNVVAQWATKAFFPNTIAVEGAANADLAFFQSFPAFELDVAISLAQAGILWDQANPIALVNPLGSIAWLTALTAASAGNLADPSVQALMVGLSANATLTTADGQAAFGSVSQWINKVALTNLADGGQSDASYSALIRAGLTASYPPAEFGTLSDWSDVGALQFGSGSLTAALGATSIEGLNLLPLPGPPEYSAWQLATPELGLNATTIDILTVQEARAFFNVFKDSGAVLTFLGVLQSAPTMLPQLFAGTLDGQPLPGVGVVPAGFGASLVSVGLHTRTPAQLAAFAQYLGEYLPMKFVIEDQLRGELRADGTGAANGGMFVRRSWFEMVFGYRAGPLNDPLYILTAVPGQPPSTFDGLLGPNMTLAEFTASNPAPSSYNTGTKNLDKLDQYVTYKGIESFQSRADRGGSCPADGSDCSIWNEPEVIKGAFSGSGIPPFSEGKEPLPSFKVYANEVLRNVEFSYTGKTSYNGIALNRYDFIQSQLTDTEYRQRYKMDGYPLGFAPLTPAAGVPLIASLPHMLDADDSERAKFDGVTNQDWNRTDVADHGVFLNIEPLTGRTMEGALRLQYHWEISRRAFNTPMYAKIFDSLDGPEADKRFIWPQFWVDQYNAIEDDDAADFRAAIYGNRDTADTVTVVGLALGIILTIGGILIIFLCYKVAEAQAAKDMNEMRARSGDLEMAN